MNQLEREQLHQARVRFYLTCILTLTSTAFCFTGVGLMWWGQISREAAMQGIKLIGSVAIAGVKILDRNSPRPRKTLPLDRK